MRMDKLIESRNHVDNVCVEAYSDEELERIIKLCDRHLSNEITASEIQELEELKIKGIRAGRVQ